MIEIGDIPSVINDGVEKLDFTKPFTFIEFIKLFEYSKEQDAEFLNAYTEYLHRWAENNSQNGQKNLEEFVQQQLFDLLKTITLSYTSYEEQKFLAGMNLDDKEQVKSAIPIYTKRILDICNFYRKKRQGVRGVIRRNSYKGSVQCIEEVVYNKIIDWVFNNKNIPIAYKEIRNNLTVSIENYVDTYSEYFDIPRDEDLQDKVRYNYDMLTSNMNTVDYRYFVSVSEVVSGMLYQGSVYLKEIPLIATLALDLGQNCVGDLLAMKNSLSYHATINRIDLDEQVAIKRDLYKKFIGCDLYYAYVDKDGNIFTDVLCRAENPTGNLLNCCSADQAVQPSYQLTELAKIGLFFKPDKCSILKVNARDYTWEFNEEVIEDDTWYIFPDPTKYGDIGTNKDSKYPLLMTYKDTYDIRNLSSGEARDYPLVFLGDQNWRAYYSTSDDEFIQFDNTKWDYKFTKEDVSTEQVFSNNAVTGLNFKEVHTYKMDMFGNQYAMHSLLYKDFGIQTMDIYDLDIQVSPSHSEYISRVKVTITEQLRDYGEIVIEAEQRNNETGETVSVRLENVESLEHFIDFPAQWNTEYEYNAYIYTHEITVTDMTETHQRILPSETVEVDTEFHPIFYTVTPTLTHSFESSDEDTKERYQGEDAPRIKDIRFKAPDSPTLLTKEEFEAKQFDYATDYEFEVYTYFECECTDPEYTQVFKDHSVDKEGTLVINDASLNVSRIHFRYEETVSYDYDMSVKYTHRADRETSEYSSIDGGYSIERTEYPAEIDKEISTTDKQ